MSNQESKFDFLATRQCLVKIDEGQQKNKKSSAPTDNQIYVVPANQFSPSPGTSLVMHHLKFWRESVLKNFCGYVRPHQGFGNGSGSVARVLIFDSHTHSSPHATLRWSRKQKASCGEAVATGGGGSGSG